MKKILLNFSFTAIMILVVAFSACDDTETITGIDGVIIPSSNVSYNQYIQPVFNLKCARSGCHDTQTRAGNLSLTSHAVTTMDYLVVAPGLPQSSKLIWAIQGTGVSLMPPFGYPALTQNQRDGIIKWVEEGAKNN